MDKHERATAEQLFIRFFKKHPRQKNPTDINTEEKFKYATNVGWENFRLMQQARKAGYSFTKRN